MTYFGPRAEICGGIASGKTTLAQALTSLDLASSFENFTENPFWAAFYRDPGSNAFETEVCFLLQHYHEIKEASLSNPRVLICDYSLSLDQAYASTTLTAEEIGAFTSVYGVLTKRIPPPILIIHLRCGAVEEHKRLLRRGREVEQNATVDFLAQLNAAIEQQLTAPDLHVPIFPIDSDRLDFTQGGADRDQVVAGARDAIRRATASA